MRLYANGKVRFWPFQTVINADMQIETLPAYAYIFIEFEYVVLDVDGVDVLLNIAKKVEDHLMKELAPYLLKI